MASMAPMLPIVPATAPNTGNARFHAGGGSGTRQARHGVRPGTIVVSWASSSNMAQSTSGFRCRTASRFSSKRSLKSGAQPTTRSAMATNRAALSSLTFSAKASTWSLGFSSRSRRAAVSIRGLPSPSWVISNWRFRSLARKLPAWARISRPTPAAAS